MTAIYKQSKKLKQVAGIQHGFFTKKGGVSSGIYSSLNCAPKSDDGSDNIIKNRKRVMSALGLQDARLFGVHQIHSTKVHYVSSDSDESVFPKGDALVTNQKGIALSVLGADCTPVLFSSTAGVVAAAHAGWQGAVKGIVESVVIKMCELGASRDDITACIGPTIHPKNYEVKDDFIQALNKLSLIPTEPFIKETTGRYYFNLPLYLLEQCKHSGITSDNLGLDTYELKDDYFSYRRNTHEGIKDYGRQISVIALV